MKFGGEIAMIIILVLHCENVLLCPKMCDCKNDTRYINCSDKKLKVIPKLIPIDVEELDLSRNIFNSLSSNSFAALINLKILRLDFCEIKHIARDAFNGLEMLKELFLKNNDIEHLNESTFMNLNRLLHLYLSNNEFQSVPPLKSFSMTRLHLDGNHISNAHIHESFKVNTALRTLVLTKNKLGSLASTDFINLRNTGLQSLMLKMNELGHIDPETFAPVKDSLQNLELEGNLLSSDQIEMSLRAFAGGSKLIFVDLRNTGLTNISRTFFRPLVSSHLHRIDIGDNPQLSIIDNDAFGELNSVQILVADKCSIFSASIRFSALTKLRELYLRHNNFVLCPHRLPGAVEIIDLAYNDIRVILKDDLKSLSSLKSLSLRNNAISDIEQDTFSDLSQLTLLDLSYNRLTVIHPRIFVGMFALSILDLRNQNPCLKHISEDSLILPNLLSLNLNRNCMDLPTIFSPIFRRCPRLSNLSLVDTTLEYLRTPLFKGLSNLTFLNLSHSQIRGWSPSTFVEVRSTLIELDLSFNNLASLSTSPSEENYLPAHFKNLQSVSLNNNHWNCSCGAVRWLLDHIHLLRHAERIICDNLRLKLLELKEMKNCSIKHVAAFQKMLHAPSSKAVLFILPLILLLLVVIAAFVMRKPLLVLVRRFRSPAYHRMLDPRVAKGGQSGVVVNNAGYMFYNNHLMDEEIPDMEGNCLVINSPDPVNIDGSVVDYVTQDAVGHNSLLIIDSVVCRPPDPHDWICRVKQSNYGSTEFIVFLSSQLRLDTGKMGVKIIDNLQSFGNKVCAYHSRILVVDYPPLDVALLRQIIRERDGEPFDDEFMKSTFVFHSREVDIDQEDEVFDLVSFDCVKEYNAANIVEQFYALF